MQVASFEGEVTALADDLAIAPLIERVKDGAVREIILAMAATTRSLSM